MTYDVRWPIGLLFLMIGVLVAGAGLFGAQPAGLNIDLAWGAVMIIFGVGMILLAALGRGSGRLGGAPTPSDSSPPALTRSDEI